MDERTRVEFSHKPLHHCIHNPELLFGIIEAGGYPLFQIREGEWSESGSGLSTKGKQVHTVYLKRDGLVVFRVQIIAPHCIKFGRYGTIDYMRGLLYYAWLMGYDPVIVPPGQRRPNDCKQYDEAMCTDNTWRLPDECLVPASQANW